MEHDVGVNKRPITSQLNAMSGFANCALLRPNLDATRLHLDAIYFRRHLIRVEMKVYKNYLHIYNEKTGFSPHVWMYQLIEAEMRLDLFIQNIYATLAKWKLYTIKIVIEWMMIYAGVMIGFLQIGAFEMLICALNGHHEKTNELPSSVCSHRIKSVEWWKRPDAQSIITKTDDDDINSVDTISAHDAKIFNIYACFNEMVL
jgi:hypothetical protein